MDYVEVVICYGAPTSELATTRHIELTIEPEMILCGNGVWLPGVTHPDAPFNGVAGDIDVETVCYAINEGREHRGTWRDDDGSYVRWHVYSDDLAVLRRHGIVD